MPFVDAQALPAGQEFAADLVIIGGGMAGLALARQFIGTGVTVAVLESGGLSMDKTVQDLAGGPGVVRAPGSPDKPFDDYLVQSRARVLGGSGAVWGGKCVPLDDADFAPRPWIPDSGWPFTREQLQPFYDRACKVLEIPPFPADDARLDAPGKPRIRIDGERDFVSRPRMNSPVSGRNDPEAFDRFRMGFVEAAPNIQVILNVTVTDIGLDPRGRQVERLSLACLNGRRHTARGRTYVLAVGGIDNPRLLLHSNGVAREGIGNRHDLVGRYFQGHATFGLDETPEGRSAIYLSRPQNTDLYRNGPPDGFHCVLALSLAGQQRHRAGNFTFTMAPANPKDLEGLHDHAAVRQAATLVDARPGAPPGVHLDGFVMSENFPNPESRVTLSDQVDALGMRRARLEWVYTEADWRSLETAVGALASALGAAGEGRFSWPIRRDRLLAVHSPSRHHIGTTRMDADPKKGVVDTDLRVHGAPNLYVAGVSVFPTSGIANPTLTLIALTLRLADHLKRELGAAA
jgi:choline dehydrogenase-like flavoprotein